MRKITSLVIIFLVLCVAAILLMRSCGGDRADEPVPTAFVPQATPEPTPEPTPIPTSEPTPAYAGSVWTTDGVNLRTGPGTEYDVYTTVDTGVELKRVDVTDTGWSEIDYSGVKCFVKTDFLSVTPPAGATSSPTFDVTPCSDTVWTTDGVNLRRGPGTDYEIAGAALKDTKLQRTGTTPNGWSRVIYENVGYYISNDFVTTVPPAEESSETGMTTPEPGTDPNAPTETPLPLNAATSGEFRSDTGTSLNVIVRWGVENGANGRKQLTLNAYLESFSVEAAQYADDLCFQIGNNTYYVTTPGVSVIAINTTETFLGSYTCEVEPGSVPVTVSWRFNGTYNGTQITLVEAADTLLLA